MSRSQVVRQRFAVREQSRRTFDQRVALRFPQLTPFLGRQILRLRPSSRLRQAALLRGVRLAVEAYNRRDMDAYVMGFDADCALYPPREYVEAGFADPRYHGPDGVREYMSIWFEVFGGDIRVKPFELIDAGERFLVLAHVPARGQASGVQLIGEFALVTTLQRGRNVREQHYLHHSEGLEAVGLQA